MLSCKTGDRMHIPAKLVLTTVVDAVLAPVVDAVFALAVDAVHRPLVEAVLAPVVIVPSVVDVVPPPVFRDFFLEFGDDNVAKVLALG